MAKVASSAKTAKKMSLELYMLLSFSNSISNEDTSDFLYGMQLLTYSW
jgi:hypothetical protein